MTDLDPINGTTGGPIGGTKLSRYRLRADQDERRYEKQSSILPALRRLFVTYIKPQAKFYAIAIVLLIIYSASVVALPYLLENVIDEFLAAKDMDAIRQVAFLGGAIILVRASSGFFQAAALSYATLNATKLMQRDAFARLLKQDYAFFLVNEPGQILQRVWNSVRDIGTLAQRVIINLGRDLVTALGLLGYMLFSNWTWALLIVILAPILAVPILVANRFLRVLARRMAGVEGGVLDGLTEVIAHIRSVKTDQGEQFERKRHWARIDEIFDIGVKNIWFAGGVEPVLDFVAAVGVTVVLLFGGSQVVNGTATAGELVAYLGALMLMVEPARRVLNLNTAIQQAAPNIERFYEIIDSEAHLKDAPNAAAFAVSPETAVTVQFDDVSFSYDGALPTLKNINFTVKPGEMVALVGPSGSGKSTIVALLARLFDVDGGSIRLNDVDLRAMKIADARAALSVVSQNAALFAGSIGENIRYGREGMQDDELVSAARVAQALEFAQALPDGLDSAVGPRGDRLSGGQKQRVAIARALAKDAPIVLLDEATSALDNDTEAAFVAEIDQMRGSRTLIVIAHRLSTIRNADRVIVLRDGEIVEQGAYDQLKGSRGEFARLLALSEG